jgi:benzoyl-CoA reductase/2-hydroxyglutaryl-CoA dehydratase subunit BcrC/BadD/HgdB
LLRQLEQTDVRGLIVWLYTWCDLWRAEVQRLRERTDLPVLCLETGDAQPLSATATHRLQAFFEMLRP